MKEKIDFVILWVDGNDVNWQNDKKIWEKNIKGSSNSINRFRDWENLKYWFRAVEKFASWVHKIYFVTYGHIPSWIDTNNKKLVIVKHEDYIPKKYLPLFNSNAIEVKLNNIKGLSDKFVLFNDDMFLIKKTKPTDFFINDLPRDEFAEESLIPSGNGDVYPFTLFNNMEIINKYFNKKEVLKKNFSKIYNLKYGIKNNIRTFLMYPWDKYSGIYNPHIPQAFLKSSFDFFWTNEKEYMINTLSNKFRDKTDTTQYLFRYYQLLSGNFVPRTHKFGAHFNLQNDNSKIVAHIIKQKTNLICINDSDPNLDFEKVRDEINSAFEKILPEKSSFEK